MLYIALLIAALVILGIINSRQLITSPPMLLLLVVGGWVLMLIIDQHVGLPITAMVGFIGVLLNAFVGIYVNYRNSIPVIKGE